MIYLAAFALGMAAGMVATFWLIARSHRHARATPKPPSDVYIDDLAAILEKEQW